MIGQNRIRDEFSSLIQVHKLPRFIVLEGVSGSGRKTLAKWLAQKANLVHVEVGKDVESIRNAVKNAYNVILPTIYVIPDGGKLSNIAQNTLLKVTEEAPNNAYFLVTVESKTDVLETILNRSFVFNMDNYSKKELLDYFEQKYPNQNSMEVLKICDVPGEIDMLMKYDVSEFLGYVDKVIDNIAVVSGANSFKIGAKIAFKDEDDKYDMALFLRAFMNKCMAKAFKDKSYARGVVITGKYIQELKINGVNKSTTFDMWLLDIRKAWM